MGSQDTDALGVGGGSSRISRCPLSGKSVTRVGLRSADATRLLAANSSPIQRLVLWRIRSVALVVVVAILPANAPTDARACEWVTN